MAGAAEIRADVATGNSEVAVAQQLLQQAVAKLTDARAAYLRIETQNYNLVGAVNTVTRVLSDIEESLRMSYTIAPQADTYASKV